MSRSPVELELRGITVRFGGVTALDDVNLSIRPGEIVGLIGPNGAGKTTLLDVVTGFTRPDRGTVLLGGTPIDRWAPERRARAGLVRSFQGVELFPELTVRDNLLVAADTERWQDYFTGLLHPGRGQGSQTMSRVIDEFELGGMLDQLPGALPHGVARRVGIARALVAEPAVLFLDEPAAGLDQVERTELVATIQRVARQRSIAVIVVEHDIALVSAVCDRIMVLDFGHVIALGIPDEVRRDDNVVRAYLGEAPADALVAES